MDEQQQQQPTTTTPPWEAALLSHWMVQFHHGGRLGQGFILQPSPLLCGKQHWSTLAGCSVTASVNCLLGTGCCQPTVLVTCLGTSMYCFATRFLERNPRSGVLPTCVSRHPQVIIRVRSPPGDNSSEDFERPMREGDHNIAPRQDQPCRMDTILG